MDLNFSYRLYAFPDCKAMTEAKAQMRRVVTAKEFSQVKEIEAKQYVQSISIGSYKNYLRENTADCKAKGIESLKTALQALYKLNGYSAKYIIIERVY